MSLDAETTEIEYGNRRKIPVGRSSSLALTVNLLCAFRLSAFLQFSAYPWGILPVCFQRIISPQSRFQLWKPGL